MTADGSLQMNRELTLEELQQIEYEMLCAVADFCEENNLRYGLAGGTLLGAVRHGGFIPWDDDIDIEMPRPDYIKFLQLADKLPEKYKVVSPYNDETCFRPYSKVCDLTTKMIEFPEGKKIETHVYLDIFPIDGVPNEPISQEKHRRSCMASMYRFMAFRIAQFKVNETRGIRKLGWKILAFLQKTVVKDSLLKAVDKKCLKYDFDKSKYSSEVIAGYGFKGTMPSVVYDFSGEIKFRDRVFKCCKYPKYYLINLYGEYWKLPPEDQRITHDNKSYKIEEIS